MILGMAGGLAGSQGNKRDGFLSSEFTLGAHVWSFSQSSIYLKESKGFKSFMSYLEM